jgi:hypothetical protein
MADTGETSEETSGFDQLHVLFEEVHCAGCDGKGNCPCGKKK